MQGRQKKGKKERKKFTRSQRRRKRKRRRTRSSCSCRETKFQNAMWHSRFFPPSTKIMYSYKAVELWHGESS
jgi:hypothetical protein